MRMADRLLMFSIEPKKSDLETPCVNISFFKNGIFVISESPSFSLSSQIKIIGSFVIKEKEFYDSLSSFLLAMKEEFESAPECLFVPGNDSSQYYLSFQDVCFGGSFVLTDDSMLAQLSKDEAKIARWNNKVVAFAKRWGDVSSYGKFAGELIYEPSEAYFIRPQSLLLLRRAKKEFGSAYCRSSMDEAMKSAARIAFQKKGVPAGKARFSMSQVLQAEVLANFNSSSNEKEFNQSLFSLAKKVSSFDENYDLCEILHWIDLLYLILLFDETLLMDERKIAFLHPPISTDELFDKYHGTDLTSYENALRNQRMKANDTSPIYDYLKELVGENDESCSRIDEFHLS